MKRIMTLLVLLMIMLASGALANPGDSLLAVEHTVFGHGASSLWKTQDFGSHDDGLQDGVPRGPTNLRQRVTAAGLSFLMPGLGQLYNGDRGKAYAFAGAELAVWLTYGVFDNIANGASEDYREYAGIYAGISGDHTERYWRSAGRFMTSELYNVSLRMEARAEERDPTGLIEGPDTWFWRNEEHQSNYQLLRADANRAFDRRDFTIVFSIINRAIAAFDAARSAGDSEHMIELAGFGVDLEPTRHWGKAGTACVVSRRF